MQIADFLLVQLSLSRFTLIKKARDQVMSVWSTSALHSFINLIIRISDVIITSVIIPKQICNWSNFFGWYLAEHFCRLAWIFSAGFRWTKIWRLSATAERSNVLFIQFGENVWLTIVEWCISGKGFPCRSPCFSCYALVGGMHCRVPFLS